MFYIHMYNTYGSLIHQSKPSVGNSQLQLSLGIPLESCLYGFFKSIQVFFSQGYSQGYPEGRCKKAQLRREKYHSHNFRLRVNTMSSAAVAYVLFVLAASASAQMAPMSLFTLGGNSIEQIIGLEKALRFHFDFVTCLPRQGWKQLKGCVFSPPSLRPVPARGREARKRNL